MSGASTSTTRSDSAHSRIADSPTSNPAAADACFDTALPPMSSKQMVISTRRPPRASESSLIATNLRNTNRAVATLPYTPPGTTTIARGPSTHRRTGSTLKTVMRKIFTRKSRGQEDDDSADCRFGNHSPRSNQSLDKPQPLSGSWNAKSTSPLQQEHGPVTSWEEALRKLEPHPRRRRATLPSLIFSDDESRSALEAVVHSGRPTSRRDNSPHANSDPDEVRRREMRQIKRRSRSATALRGMAKDHLMSPIQWRRRSLESYAGSTTFGAVSEADASERPPTRTTVASAPKPTTEPSFLDGPDEDDEEDAPEEPMPQMVGTLVNSLQHDENVTLEQRLTTLEVKLIDLECAIARIQSGRSETPAEPSGQRKPSPPTTRHKRKQSSAQSPSGSDETPGAKSPGGADRPSSTSTLRPNHLHRSRTLQAPSSTSLHECNTISVEQYSALVMLLRREQSARRNLEEQVSSLRSDVEQLTRVARESMGMGPIYPIPIDAHDIMRMRQALGPSPTNSGPPTEKISPDSDSEERPELPPKGDLYHPRWPSARRVEVGGMI